MNTDKKQEENLKELNKLSEKGFNPKVKASIKEKMKYINKPVNK